LTTRRVSATRRRSRAWPIPGLRRDDQRYNDIRNSKTSSSWAAIRRKPIRYRCSICWPAGAEPRQLHRDRPAPHPHRCPRDGIWRGAAAPHRAIYGILACSRTGEDKEFIAQRVYGMDDVRKEVEKEPAGGRERHRSARGATSPGRRMIAEQAGDPD
jgi:hypothetical protein